MSLYSRFEDITDLSIGDIKLVLGPKNGVSIEAQTVKICQSLCKDLTCGEVETILLEYTLKGAYGLEIPRTAVFNLSNNKNCPKITSHFESKPSIENGIFSFDLSVECRLFL